MNKKILLIIIAVILLIVIISGIVFIIVSTKLSSSKEEVLKVDKKIVMYEFDESFVTNVKDSKKILKTVIEVELANKKIEELVRARESEIRNEIYLILRSKREEDFEGAEGQIKLQKEITDGIKNIIKTENVLNVYFREFIIQ
ncbi:MAG: flagellar basal body-associated FliL family protein [Firmicutes bacterium]|nr:flagellar basal body-associated FliL family protein [Bacillota bacterium]